MKEELHDQRYDKRTKKVHDNTKSLCRNTNSFLIQKKYERREMKTNDVIEWTEYIFAFNNIERQATKHVEMRIILN